MDAAKEQAAREWAATGEPGTADVGDLLDEIDQLRARLMNVTGHRDMVRTLLGEARTELSALKVPTRPCPCGNGTRPYRAGDLRAELDLAQAQNGRLRTELDRLEALALEQARLRTLGGIPPVPARDWGNLAYTTPPASASTADAPPLHRPTVTESS